MSQDKSKVIEAKNIFFEYRPTVRILENISFSLSKGDSLGIIGPNGGGKSTLLKILIGLLRPTKGNIYIKQKKIQTPSDIPYSYMAHVPQVTKLNLLMPIRVIDLIKMGSLNLDHKDAKNQLKDKSIEDVLNRVGLEDKAHKLVADLSQGEKQRALMGKALIRKPQILIMDEPNTGLDSTGQDQMLSILKEIKSKHQTTIIIVDHNLQLIMKYCEKILCLNRKHHWHNSKNKLTKNVLESIYHCEFEHLLIHESDTKHKEHFQCSKEHSHKKHEILKKSE